MRKVVTDKTLLSELDKKEIQTFIRKNPGDLNMALVAQGGGQLGVFTAGVLDAFLDTKYDPFSMYVGTSAGALNLSSYLTQQYRFAYHFIREVTTDPQFFNLARFIRYNQGMDLEWAISNASGRPEFDLDIKRGRKNLRGKIGLAGVTQSHRLEAHYFPLFRSNWLDVLKATSAIPLIHTEPVIIAGIPYYDGGISCAIPAQKAYRLGAKVIVVIRTEPVENESRMNRGENIGYLSQLHDSFMTSLPNYLKRLNLDSSKGYVENFHLTLSNRLKKFARLKDKVAPNLSLDLEKTGQHWLFDRNSMYRIIAMTGKHTESQLIDILIKHYESYEKTIHFLANPPQDVLIIEIAPQVISKAKPLLTRKEILDNEYCVGATAGENFLHIFNKN